MKGNYMKKRLLLILIIMIGLVCIPTCTYASNSLVVDCDKQKLSENETTDCKITANTDYDIIAYSFKVIAPKGLEVSNLKAVEEDGWSADVYKNYIVASWRLLTGWAA